ncbi:MAG: glycosyltransferase family 4 protein [Ardenticatenaceae bacterium]|nr:glycosyltransferase family 4 protein [Ardenticatenaceae bacterium]HBY94112.1 glycosyl transferase [Chloroflexota bacterium]
MRIALIAPLYERVPPEMYGGTERVVYCLAEELVRRGHAVTLFASGDSLTSAELVPGAPQSLRRRMTRDQLVMFGPPLHLAMLAQVSQRADEFDIIHSHIDHWAFPFSRLIDVPMVSTIHGRLDVPDLDSIFRLYPETALVSISDSQRRPFDHLKPNWVATVYNGITTDRFTFNPEPGDYLVFLGRLSQEKRPDRAIEIARRVGMPLKIAAKVDPLDQEYFQTQIEPLLHHPLIEYVGEVDDTGKDELLCRAYATLFPIDWPEPFGLTMIESLACGTPVIAMRNGSVPEVMVDGVTGFICETVDEMAAALSGVAGLDRAACRRHVESRFSAEVMADGYEAVYRTLLERESMAIPGVHTNGHQREKVRLLIA